MLPKMSGTGVKDVTRRSRIRNKEVTKIVEGVKEKQENPLPGARRTPAAPTPLAPAAAAPRPRGRRSSFCVEKVG